MSSTQTYIHIHTPIIAIVLLALVSPCPKHLRQRVCKLHEELYVYEVSVAYIAKGIEGRYMGEVFPNIPHVPSHKGRDRRPKCTDNLAELMYQHMHVCTSSVPVLTVGVSN